MRRAALGAANGQRAHDVDALLELGGQARGEVPRCVALRVRLVDVRAEHEQRTRHLQLARLQD